MEYLRNFAKKYAAPILGLAIAAGIFAGYKFYENKAKSAETDNSRRTTNNVERTVEPVIADANRVCLEDSDSDIKRAEKQARIFSDVIARTYPKELMKSDEQIWDDLVTGKYYGGEK